MRGTKKGYKTNLQIFTKSVTKNEKTRAEMVDKRGY